MEVGVAVEIGAAGATPSCRGDAWTLLPGDNVAGENVRYSGQIISSDACAEYCCATTGCVAFTFTSAYPYSNAGDCKHGQPCCFAKSTHDATGPKANCSSGVLPLPPPPPCDRGWHGPACGQLNLDAPASVVYPAQIDLAATAWEDRPYPWGGDCLADDEQYHCFFAEFDNHCPMSYGTWYSSTHIRHVTALTPTGPYTRRDVAVPRAAGNPVLLKPQPADGFHVLYFTNQRFEAAVRECRGRSPAAFSQDAVYNCKLGAAGEPPMGVNMAYSRSLNGPWQVRHQLIEPLVPESTNPAVVLLPNGTVLLAYKTWPGADRCRELIGSTECKAIGLLSSHPHGWNASSYSHRPTGDRFVAVSRDVEDPSMYRDPQSGAIHMLLHVEGAGGSAHSSDDGSTWQFRDTDHSYEYPVMLSGSGEWLALTNREEPKLLLDATGWPTHLITQAALRSLSGPQDQGSPKGCRYEGPQSTKLTFVLMQPINASKGTPDSPVEHRPQRERQHRDSRHVRRLARVSWNG